MGGVFSQKEGFTSLSLLWAGLAFHAVTMAVGLFLAAHRFGAKKAAPAAALPGKS